MSRILGRDPSGEIEFRLLTDDRIEQVLAVQQETMREECLALGLGLWDEPGAAEEMLLIFRQVIKDGISVIALDTSSNQVAAVSFNKLHKALEYREEDSLGLFVEGNIKHPACLELIRFLDQVETMVDIFQKYKIKGAMELFYIGTRPSYQGRGLAKQIVSVSLHLAKGLSSGQLARQPIAGTVANQSIVPELVFGVFASSYSQRIALNLGFEPLARFPYEQYTTSGGRKLSERIAKNHENALFAAYTI